MRLFVRTTTRSLLLPGELEWKSEEYAPTGALAQHVACIRSGRDVYQEPLVEDVLPDGSVHVLFSLGDAPTATVLGARKTPLTIELRGVIEHVGIELRAGGAAAVLGVSAHELEEREVPLEALWGKAARQVVGRMAEATPGARPALVAQLLRAHLAASGRSADRRARAIAERIVAAHGAVRTRALAEEFGLGERRLEQIFRSEVGLSPKAFSRVARFRHAIDVLYERQASSLAALSRALGYHDQAHFTADFRAISGRTPGSLLAFGNLQSRLARPG